MTVVRTGLWLLATLAAGSSLPKIIDEPTDARKSSEIFGAILHEKNLHL